MKPMKPNKSAAFVTAIILAVGPFQPSAVSAQDVMKDMPGMATPKPKEPATVPAMKDMPGMAPAAPSVSPSTADAARAEQKKMEPMPGMENGAATAQPMSEPGIRILGPHREWVPPRGDNRADELFSRRMLEAHLEDLPEPVEDSMINSLLLFDLLEYRAYDSGPETMVWDFVGWMGGDYNRLWIKSEGDLNLSSGNGVEGDLQLLYGRLDWSRRIGISKSACGKTSSRVRAAPTTRALTESLDFRGWRRVSSSSNRRFTSATAAKCPGESPRARIFISPKNSCSSLGLRAVFRSRATSNSAPLPA